MKKSKITALMCIVAAVGAVCSSVVTFAALSQNESRGSYVNSRTADFPHFQGVTKSDGYYNISLVFSNVTDPERLDNILINPQSPETVTNLTAYLKGTAIDAASPISCNLKSGDGLQVDLTLPCIEYASGTTITLQVMDDVFGCGVPVVLP